MSFSKSAKEELCSEKKREPKPCCREALLHGMLVCAKEYSEKKIVFISESEKVTRYFASLMKAVFRAQADVCRKNLAGHRMYSCEYADDTVKTVHSRFDLFTNPRRMNESVVFACDKCSAHFLRGLFLAHGHVGDPTGESRLEIGIPDADLASDVDGLLSITMLPPSRSLHRGKPVLLYKKAQSVENFLAFIGADGAVLELMSEKLVKELRNDTNRRSNLEASGINRAVSAAVRQTEAIKKIEKSGLLGTLPEELRNTAELRLKFPNIPLAELAAKHEPPISKSGLSHRLAKITEFSKEYTDD